jgi:hypothetical protein
VPQMKANRRNAARSRPQIGSIQPASGARQVSLRLQQRVCGGLQERRDRRHRSSEPELGSISIRMRSAHGPPRRFLIE